MIMRSVVGSVAETLWLVVLTSPSDRVKKRSLLRDYCLRGDGHYSPCRAFPFHPRATRIDLTGSTSVKGYARLGFRKLKMDASRFLCGKKEQSSSSLGRSSSSRTSCCDPLAPSTVVELNFRPGRSLEWVVQEENCTQGSVSFWTADSGPRIRVK